jgi:hypothetical protein
MVKAGFDRVSPNGIPEKPFLDHCSASDEVTTREIKALAF